MSWAAANLAKFKAYLGGTPAPSDEQATAALVLALQVAESWLDRPLELKERTQEDGDQVAVILLRAWPVQAVASVTFNGGQAIDLAHAQLNKSTGRLVVPGIAWGLVETVYTGGYPDDAFPPDLQFALFAIASALYPQLTPGAGGNGSAASQPVVRVSTPDVGMIEFARAGQTGADSRILGATLSPAIDSLIGRYRNESVIGGA